MTNRFETTDAKTRSTDCPAETELSGWLNGECLDRQDIVQHVENCPACRRVLDRLTTSTLVNAYADTVSQRPNGLSFLAPPLRSGELGRLHHFSLERELDSGGMGIVYKAWDSDLNRPVAIKLMRFLDNAEAKQRFRREAQAIAKLNHEHIVPILSVAESADGRPYLVMPLIEGETLRQRLTRSPIRPREAAEWIRQVARGLHVAHQAGLIHRDIKPSNILLDQNQQRAKLADFGLVRNIAEQSLAPSAGILGTPEFMSPEQIANSKDLDGRSDVYSLGISLYQCLTGVVPFRGDTFEILQQHREQEPIPPSRLNPAIPPDLQTICLKAIGKEPAQRYASALALADDLERFLAGEPILASGATALQRTRKWVRKHPWQTLSAALVVAALVGAMLSAVMLERLRRDADASFQLTRTQLVGIFDRLKNDLLQVPQVEQAAIQSIRDVVHLYGNLNRLRPNDQEVAEEYLSALKDWWYSEWLYDGDQREQEALDKFQTDSQRLMEHFPDSTKIAALRAELLLDLAIEFENAGDEVQSIQHEQQGNELLVDLLVRDPRSLPVNTLAWKSAYQGYQKGIRQKQSPETLVELAEKMVRLSESVLELTPPASRNEATCICIDQISRLVEAQIANEQLSAAETAIQDCQSLLNSLTPETGATLEVRQAKARILRAQTRIARASIDPKKLELALMRWVTANREIIQSFPEGEVQAKVLAESICELIECRLSQGTIPQVSELEELRNLLQRVGVNPSVSAWASPLRERLEKIESQMKTSRPDKEDQTSASSESPGLP
jgi:hypothetical protein